MVLQKGTEGTKNCFGPRDYGRLRQKTLERKEPQIARITRITRKTEWIVSPLPRVSPLLEARPPYLAKLGIRGDATGEHLITG
jgi:hypothetical protein